LSDPFAEHWGTVRASDVKVGKMVRMKSGEIFTVARIERPFLGLPAMLAFIEDSPERWFKQPMALDPMVEVRVEGVL
jgi:hypothetical protein